MTADSQHFERLYRLNPDPWQVATAWYERRKRNLLLAALPNERYRHGFEPGCGNGGTTIELLRRCDRLCAVDGSATAVGLCAARVRDAGAARCRLELNALSLPEQWPAVPALGFDLIVVSELAYYFDADALQAFVHKCLASLGAGGHLLMCHWLGEASDRRHSTPALHRLVADRAELHQLFDHTEAEFQLHGWEKRALGEPSGATR